MRQLFVSAFALLLAFCFSASPASARRVALVFGLSSYNSLASLPNPEKDAKAIASVLRKNGFRVFEHYNLLRADFLDALEAFREEADKATVALVYYAGHGMEIGGKNILAPRDMEIQCQPKKAKRAVPLRQVFEAISGAPKQIVLLDACRNDPFPQCPTRSARAGTGFRALSRIDTEDSSVLIVNATLSGQLAADGDAGEHSPFAKALLARFNESPRTYFRDLLDQTAADVRRATFGAQVPEVTSRGGAPRICLAGEGCVSAGAEYTSSGGNPADPHEVRALLNDLGFSAGAARKAGGLTEAVRKFQASSGLPPDGRITATLLAVLRATKMQLAALPRPRGKPTLASIFKQSLEYEVGQTFRDCEVCPEMAVVPSGSFKMGSSRQSNERPVHNVQVKRPFAMAKFEITFDEWEACAFEGGCNGYKPKDSGWGRGRRPVIYVSWEDAKSYIAWLRRKTGKAYRLATEAEWEFAARGGTATPYSTGRTILTSQANFDGTQGANGRRGNYRGKTVDVGSFEPNPFGLHDMHGNVAEWVEDCWNASHSGAPGDSSARGGNCSRRVLKGGAWYYEPEAARAPARLSYAKTSRLNIVGYRVVRSLE